MDLSAPTALTPTAAVPQVEHLLGKKRFLIIFFVSLLGGSLASTYFMAPMGYSIGASGAIFGLFGAFVVIGRKLGANVNGTLAIIGINFAIGFTIGGVDWHAHLGGLIAGAIVTKVLITLRS